MSLRKFMPRRLYPTRTPEEWEKKILSVFQSLSSKSEDEARAEYIRIVQNWPFYGTTFFSECKMTNKKPQVVIIGVNEEGIVLLKKSGELFSAFPFSDIVIWRASFESFEFECSSESEIYHFETFQGESISMTIQGYVDMKIMLLLDEECDG
eukprot:TRINITY_DN2599_c0_g1_i1.p1 TRINITY_DN2599_c0_g1~~TRINITY_DN2599_c0_g1_i1.p1  ORF type:complete len:152 (-),score=23.10 TRINITY_DN2599_c0_g1_i1:49-504(-)